MIDDSISPQQSRSARAWLGWTLEELAVRSRVSVASLVKFERGTRVPQERTSRDIRRAMEEAGIEFLFDGAKAVGVRTRPVDPDSDRTTG
jgi:transcriptional regulator with XRE-family HTH domain